MAGQATVTIRDRQWDVSLAATPYELASGLGNISQIPPQTGMLFDVGTTRIIQVTTVPMLFSLDIAFLSETLVVTEVYRNIEPGYLVTSTIPARYFFEVNAGELDGVDAGDRASVEVIVPAQAAVPDWVSALFGFIGMLVAGIIAVSMVKELVKGLLEEPEKPALLAHTGPRKTFVPVKRVPSTISKGNLASEILKGLSSQDSYRAYVRHPRDKSAFVTIGAIIGGHYSWNPAGFTVWVDAWERNPEWPSDHILAIKELRRPRTFEATEEGVKKALEYVETEFPTFTETMWVSKSIPIYVAHELGIMKKEAAPEWLPGVVVMPKIPEEARKDVLFVQYIHDLVRLGERISDEEVKVMWEAWKKRELSKLPHNELIKRPKDITRPAVIPTEKRPRREGELEFLPDSPEFLAYTIDDIGYREKIDSAFQQAIARTKRSE